MPVGQQRGVHSQSRESGATGCLTLRRTLSKPPLSRLVNDVVMFISGEVPKHRLMVGALKTR